MRARCSNSKQKRTSACAARAGRIRAACDDDDDGADVEGIEEGEKEEGEDGESDATREEGERRAARICRCA